MPPVITRRPSPRRRTAALLTYKRILFGLALPLGLLLTSLAAAFPNAVEQVYSLRLYRAMRAVFARLTSLLPVSLAELVLCTALLALAVWIARGIVRRVRRRPAPRRERRALRAVSTLICAAGVLYGWFVLTCGINYHRPSFAEQSGLAVRDSSVDELAALYAELAETANALRPLVPEDADGVMSFGGDSVWAIAAQAPAGFDRLAAQYPFFGGYTPRPKPVLASRLMSWCDITGIYIPFTFEANVNVDIVAYNIPFTIMHELAHAKGFMQEEEANFIGYLACREMEDPRFAYSGAAIALTHAGNALYSADPDRYYELYAQLSDGVRRDLAANSAYWRQFVSPIADVATAVNDVYLKTNRQTDGVKSYGRMVDLLLADYRQRHGID